MSSKVIKSAINMVKSQKYVLNKAFDGMPKLSDFKLVEEELRDIENGEIITEAQFLSVDPYMRAYAGTYSLGSTIIGYQVAKVIESKNPQFPKNSYVVGHFGWRTHTIMNPEKVTDAETQTKPYIVPELKGLPMSLYLGMLGMPGNTAYFGLMEVCKPIAGDTVVISTAGGAVGSHVGQIAKIKGCKAVGVTGSDQKGEWLKSIGFDAYINYKTTPDLSKAIAVACPRGVDVYFDNVGGEMSSIIMQHMNPKGRVGVCGSISAYNSSYNDMPKATVLQPVIVMKKLRVEGLYATDYTNRWMEGILQNKKWLESGELKYKETVFEGFKNMPNALISILKGENIGKAVVKA